MIDDCLADTWNKCIIPLFSRCDPRQRPFTHSPDISKVQSTIVSLYFTYLPHREISMDHHDDLIDVNAPATAETIIHALSQFKSDHDLAQAGYRDDHQSNLNCFQDRLTSSTDDEDTGGYGTLGGMSRRQLEDEVIRLRGLVQEPAQERHADDGAKLVAEPSRKRRKKTTPAVEAEAPVREMQAGTGKRVERDRKTELYKAIRHRVSCCLNRF